MPQDETVQNETVQDESSGLDPQTADLTSEATPDKENAWDYVKDLRKESAKYRLKAKELEEKLREYEERDLSELEKLKKRAEEAEQQAMSLKSSIEQREVRYALTLEATRMNFHDPADAFNNVNVADLDFDEDGTPTRKSVQKALKTLAEQKPYLVKETVAGSADGGARGAGPASFDSRVAEEEKALIERGYIPAPIV